MLRQKRKHLTYEYIKALRWNEILNLLNTAEPFLFCVQFRALSIFIPAHHILFVFYFLKAEKTFLIKLRI